MATIAHGPGSVAAGKARTSDSALAGARERAAGYVLAGLRLSLGWVFLWAFLDKLFGLGHETASKAAWIHGGSPTEGFLKFGAKGVFSGFYHSIAGSAWADWLFMIGLAGIALALITGIGMRVAAATGTLLLLMMWSVVLPPANNVFMDDHLVYAGLLVGLALLGAENTWGLGRWWGSTKLVSDNPWLK
jgi:thiosulfate dehydrogenase (quinone) large subunit